METHLSCGFWRRSHELADCVENDPELAIMNDGYTTTINSTHAVITVTRRPTRSEYHPASGQITAAKISAISDTSNAIARFNPPATCRYVAK